MEIQDDQLLVENRVEEMGLKDAAPVLRDDRVGALQHGGLVYPVGRTPICPSICRLSFQTRQD